ncbi:peptide deformylase [Candidatus Daviesbacteria bacterium]|nr:peptide deformylase [Candidatus Daviesbacteria bacterium]
MRLKPLKTNDPKLRQVSQEISQKELKDKNLQLLIETFLDYVFQNNFKDKGQKRRNAPSTVGLSANQVGILRRISIVDLAIGKRHFNDIHSLINPEITWRSKTLIERCEGCVNLPQVFGLIKRSKRVKVKAYDRSGNLLMLDLGGWPAVLLQHEIDHLNGFLFIDHLRDPKRAHKVLDSEVKDYRKKYKNWDKFIDVSQWVRK